MIPALLTVRRMFFASSSRRDAATWCEAGCVSQTHSDCIELQPDKMRHANKSVFREIVMITRLRGLIFDLARGVSRFVEMTKCAGRDFSRVRPFIRRADCYAILGMRS